MTLVLTVRGALPLVLARLSRPAARALRCTCFLLPPPEVLNRRSRARLHMWRRRLQLCAVSACSCWREQDVCKGVRTGVIDVKTASSTGCRLGACDAINVESTPVREEVDILGADATALMTC